MNHQGTPLINLALPWKPQTKERPRFVRATGRAYTPKNTLAAEALLLAEFRDQAPDWVPYEGPVHVEYTFTNSHVGVVMREHPAYDQRQLRGDLDNYVKLVSDSLNSHLFKDDRQIVSSHSVKL